MHFTVMDGTRRTFIGPKVPHPTSCRVVRGTTTPLEDQASGEAKGVSPADSARAKGLHNQ